MSPPSRIALFSGNVARFVAGISSRAFAPGSCGCRPQEHIAPIMSLVLLEIPDAARGGLVALLQKLRQFAPCGMGRKTLPRGARLTATLRRGRKAAVSSDRSLRAGSS